MSSVRVRFPPSPTGYCHVGTARMAVLNYLFARKKGGVIIFRSEDTDTERSTREYEEDITEQLHWLGLSWDEFYRQSERTELYTRAINELIAADRAYVSQEESKKEPGMIVKIIRLRNPGKSITFTDIIHGDITFDTTELADFAIARAIDDPLYHLSVVVDDAAMGITHVIRGEDHISNTPRQILIQEALGYARPQYAHYPLHLSTDRSKLSKRKGDVAVRSYREKGYLAEALLNYLATLGWTPPSGKEVLSLPEMLQEFDLKDIHKSGAIFDTEKLSWYNRHYLRAMDESMFKAYSMAALKPALEQRGLPWDENMAMALVPAIRERINVAADIADRAMEGEFDFFFSDPPLDASRIAEKKSDPQQALQHLHHAQKTLETIRDADWNAENIKNTLWDYATEHGRGAVLWPLRYALSGRDKSPDPFAIAGNVGKETTMRRIENAITILERV